MGAGEVAAARLVEYAHQVDHRGGATHHALERCAVVNVRLDDIDRGQQDQMLRVLAPPRRHDDPAPRVGELTRQVATDKAASAEDEDRRIAHRSTVALAWCPPCGASRRLP